MSIGRIHLKGFKSFGGSHEIALCENFTAVVGPNGCGKSNILDALRWVLGDGNPGRLRILKQGDLLFQGSISLPPAASSEVMIHLREEEKVSTLRRRFSNEEGGILLFEGRRIRLADLDEIKRRWRLEGDRFSFISQGEISEVIQQKPLQRRMHLESLFGIDLYRKQREEAALKLDAAFLELQRIITLQSELLTRKEVIADPVLRAREAKAVIDDLERQKSRLYWIKRARSERAIEGIEAELSDLGAQARAASFWASGWNRAMERLEGTLDSAAGGRSAMAVRLAGLEGDLDGAKKRLYALSTSLAGSLERRRSLQDDLARENEGLTGVRARLEELQEEADLAGEEEKEASRSFQEAENRWEQYRGQVKQRLDAIKALRRERAAGEAALVTARSRARALGLSYLEALDEISGAEERMTASGRELAALKKDLEDKSRAEEEARGVQRDAYAAFQHSAASLQKVSREISALEGQVETLRETAFTRLYPPAVQHLVAASRLGRIDASPRPLADVITCPERLVTALESFLGARQYLLFVKDIDEAGRCIAHLKARSAGRATFLPRESARPRTPAQGIAGDRKGIVGWARDLLGVENEWERCVLHVLGDLLIVEDFDTARDLAREGYRGPAVTLEGDVFQPGGTISGGRVSKGPGVMEIRREIQEKEKTAGDLKAEKARLEGSMAALEREEESASGLLRRLSDERRSLEEKLRLAEAAEGEAGRALSRAEGRKKEVEAALSNCGRDHLEITTRLRELGGDAPEDPDPSGEVELVRALEESRTRAEVAAERSGNAVRLLSMAREELRKAASRWDRSRRELEELERTASSVLKDLSEGGRAYHASWSLLQEALSLSQAMDADHAGALAALELARKRSSLASSRMEGLDLGIRQAEQRLESTRVEVAESIDMWEERFPYPGGDGIDTREYERIRRNVRELERSLREIGDVDLGVLSEDLSLTERLEFLEDQVRDVSTGIEELRRLIDETDRQAGALFLESLKAIDRKFCGLFQRLFGGGEAHLRLSDGDNPWEAGVEVIARPPGKRPQHLAQLSGGEQSLSAISLLFAAMEVAGAPIAVLDEVDASLDEVNLRRFSELAREYSRSMQLICMTHRRATMERADLLYGITMPEPGLSQVVGVRVEDWE